MTAARSASHVKQMLRKNRSDFRGILLREYPAFVLRDGVERLAEVPVFAFHDVTAASLVPMLRFLAENGYSTLSADEYVERRASGEGGRAREVVLTFDDGCKSLYTVVYPALKAFGLKAVAYVVPGMTLEDDDPARSGPLTPVLCNWRELQEMHESGVIDVQSHSVFHHSVPVSSRVIDFVRPGLDLCFLRSDLAPLKARELPWGTPLYESAARFADRPAFRANPGVAAACAEYVERHGGEAFFGRADWRVRLDRVLGAARRGKWGDADLETEEERRRAMLTDLIESKREIARRLPGKVVRHLAFPWYRGSALAARLSAEAGYVSNAWAGVLPGFLPAEKSPIPVPRLFPAYFWRLPGTGRKAIGAVLKARLSEIRNGAGQPR